MLIYFIIFISIAIAIIFGAHYFIYFSIKRFFELRAAQQSIAFYMMIFSSLSFIGANFLIRAAANSITKGFYLFSSIWSGMLLYFLLVSILGWVVFLINKTIKYNNIKLIYIILFTGAFLVSLYGIYNANNPKLKFIEVKIKNLPEFWQDKTAVHISDLHLGAINGAKFINKINKLINSVNPDIIFITGDYFDGTCPDLRSQAEPLNELNPPLGIYFINGNHETYAGTEKITIALAATGVRYLRDEIVDINGLDIAGLDFPSDQMQKDYSDILNKINPEKPTILLYHQPGLHAAAKKAGVNLQLAGHTHKGQLWPFGYITKMIFGKYYNGLHTEGDYNMFTSAGAGTWGPPMRVGNRSEVVVIKFR